MLFVDSDLEHDALVKRCSMSRSRSKREAAAERGRWSSRRMTEAILRVLRGKALDPLSPELGSPQRPWSTSANSTVGVADRKRIHHPGSFRPPKEQDPHEQCTAPVHQRAADQRPSSGPALAYTRSLGWSTCWPGHSAGLDAGAQPAVARASLAGKRPLRTIRACSSSPCWAVSRSPPSRRYGAAFALPRPRRPPSRRSVWGA